MWLVIGVSGVTCGGKTTLANRLSEVIPNTLCVNQDKYFLPEDSDRHVFIPELKHNNWEILSSVDMDKMIEDINHILATLPKTDTAVLIIEGHTIFNHQLIARMCTKKFYITLTKEDCFARRSVRTYDPADVPGYFEKIVWPEHEKHKCEMEKTVKDIIMMDGTMDKDTLLDIAEKEIMLLIKSITKNN